MFRAVMLSCLTLLAVILAVFGVSRTGPTADLVLANQGQINTLDPQQISWNADIGICLNIFEGLTTYDPKTLRPTEGVSRLPPTIDSDGLTYTFQLREDAKWRNGDPVTASDFVRGWRRAIEPGSAADYAFLITQHIKGARSYYDWRHEALKTLSQLQQLASDPSIAQSPTVIEQLESHGLSRELLSSHIEPQAIIEQLLSAHSSMMESKWSSVGIRALGDHVLRIELARATPYLLELTSMPVLMPIHSSIEKLRVRHNDLQITRNGLVTYDTQWTKPDYNSQGYPGLITNGPYYIYSWEFRRRLKLRRNPHFHSLEDGMLDRIEVHMFENAHTAFQAYETGTVDWLTDLSVDYIKALLAQQRQGLRTDIHVVPAFGTFFYNLNCIDSQLPNGQRNPFVDARVRKAFSLAVDREALCKNVVGKGNEPALTIIPAGSIADYPHMQGLRYDLEAANALLDESGYADRSSFPSIGILYNTGFDHTLLATALAHMWTTGLDVRIELIGKERKTFAEDKAKRNYAIARGGWYGDYSDPTTFLDIFATGNGNNDSGYSNDQYDALLDRANKAPDSTQRMKLLAEAEAMLITREFPAIPVYQYTNPIAFRETIQGIYPNPRELYLWRHIRVDP